MTNQSEKATEPMCLMKRTTEGVFGLYGQVKNYSPYLKTAAENVESRIPQEWTDKVVTTAQPLMVKADEQIDQAYKVVTDKTAEVKKVVTDKTAEVTKVVTDKTAEVTKVVTEQKDFRVQQWKDLRGDLSKKAALRLENGLAEVREFSATRGKDIIHFDLIAYSEELAKTASDRAMPLVESGKEQVTAAYAKVGAATVALQEQIATKSAQTAEQMDAVRAELKERLHTAITAARELSNSSLALISTKYSELEARIPAQYQPANLKGQLPERVQQSLTFIINSPKLFEDVYTKADLTTSKKTVDNLHNLLAAVREVFSSAVEAPVAAVSA